MNKAPTSIGIFYGSTTGNTETIAERLKIHIEQLGEAVQIYDIGFTSLDKLNDYPFLILGLSTWYYGGLQSDWGSILSLLGPSADWTSKTVALFGCGDQEDYSDYFCDALGILYRKLAPHHPRWLGKWPTEGYHFQRSQARLSPDYFVGLPIDEDRQAEKTEARLKIWSQQIMTQWRRVSFETGSDRDS